MNSSVDFGLGPVGGVGMGKMMADGGGGYPPPECNAARCMVACPCNVHGCSRVGNSMGDLSAGGNAYQHGYPCSQPPEATPGTFDWHTSTLDPLRGPQPAPFVDSEDSPIMLSSSTSLERDVRELKRYVRMFVNRQKESARKNAIAMEWRTMALVLDRLFFFLYIAAIGIAIVTSIPGPMEEEG